MAQVRFLPGFSKLAGIEKAKLISQLSANPEAFINEIESHLHPNKDTQRKYSEFSENTLSNYYLPYGIAPNFLIDGELYHVPMVIEESSVVAAASAAAKFWFDRGGFQTIVHSTIKKGFIYFTSKGDPEKLSEFFTFSKDELLASIRPVTNSMSKRGGGIKELLLIPRFDLLINCFQLEVSFQTANAMGANFINTTLEELSTAWKDIVEKSQDIDYETKDIEIIMSILSNYTPECMVSCKVETTIEKLDNSVAGMNGNNFAKKFSQAIQIASRDVSRAVTHNKGIMNGVDAVVLATGNDFRAVEANIHAYAAHNGKYQGLSMLSLNKDLFSFQLKIPLAIGSVGGMTTLHPLAKKSLELLRKPGSEQLMKIIASVGLATHFSSIKSLISVGIQKGHMKLHLSNILYELKVSSNEEKLIREHFVSQRVSVVAVREYLEHLRVNRNEFEL